MSKSKTKKTTRREPTYLIDNSKGRAFTWLYELGTSHRKKIALGPAGSPESYRAFAAVQERWKSIVRGTPPPPPPERQRVISIAELCARFLSWGRGHYVKHGRPTGELQNYEDAMRPLLRLYRDLPVSECSPKKLQAVQNAMVEDGLSRKVVNVRVRKLRRVLGWGVGEELVHVTVHEALKRVAPLQRGRTKAPERPPVEPVSDEVIEATLAHLPPMIRAMVQIQRFTGMRPNEVCQLCLADIDTTRDVWVFSPRLHKLEHLGKPRLVAIGPRAQRLLRPYLSLDKEAFIFSPAKAEEERRALMRAARQTPVQPSQQERDRQRQENPQRKLGDRWDSPAYRRRIHRACKAAGVEKWSPNQLRHTALTAVENAMGEDAARAVGRHTKLDTTAVYVKRDVAKAVEAMREIG